MSSTNTAYSRQTIQPSIHDSIVKRDRIGLLGAKMATQFNTYKAWGGFVIMQEWENAKDGSGEKLAVKDANGSGIPGRKSLFSNVASVNDTSILKIRNNAPLIDTPELRRYSRKHTLCTINELVRASAAGEMGKAIYDFSDFMYCKYLGKVSNNYLITLRRFPYPAGDHINFIDPSEKHTNHHMSDVGRLVTWMGTPGNEMANLMKYSYHMDWKEQESNIQEVDTGQGPGGVLGSMTSLFNSHNQDMIMDGTGSNAALNGLTGFIMGGAGSLVGNIPLVGPLVGAGITATGSLLTGDPPYENADWMRNYDEHKVYGPINTINKTTVVGDGGLTFEQSISITFDYELRSYDGINGKAAMLDLLSNVLSVTHTTGKFWGGGYHFYGQHQDGTYANLPIFNMKSGDHSMSSVIDSFMESFSEMSKSGLGKAANAVGDAIASGNIVDLIKSGLSNLGGLLAGGALNKIGRPQKFALTSLLKPDPTGFWHLTIGNPKAPMMTMGNLILENCEVEHYGPLGIDDFPTGLRVTVSLKHGKPRANTEIEQMYLSGDYRIYSLMGDKVEKMYQHSPNYKSQRKKKKTEKTVNPNDPYNIKENWSGVVAGAETVSRQTTAAKESLGAAVNSAGTAVVSTVGETNWGKKVLNKFFGTEDTKVIANASAEAMFGSQKDKGYAKSS